MLAHLASYDFDLNGVVSIELESSTDMGPMARRVSRSATLDGGVAVYDGGFSHGDRTLTLAWKSSDRALEEAIERLCTTYARLRLSLDSGVYEVAPETYTYGVDESELTLLVVQKESADA